jgi:uncharacterized membrane protein YkoI
MNIVPLLIVMVGCAGGVTAQATALSQVHESGPSTVPAPFQAGMSLGQAVSIVQAKYGAKSMRASTTNINGRIVHEIRLRSADGSRVWTVHVDAASGREL